MSEESGAEIGDPYSSFVPVLAGYDPGNAIVEVNDELRLEQALSEHRNLWTIVVDDNDIVTFDADHFSTTTDLGDYILGVYEELKRGLEAEAGDVDDDPRRLGDAEGAAFQ